MGKLIALLLNDRLLLRCIIYGSEPPSHDTFWKMYEKFGAEVFTFPRSKMTGGEKRVDAQLSSDMVKTAWENKSLPFNTLIAVGTDLLPPMVVEAVTVKYDTAIFP